MDRINLKAEERTILGKKVKTLRKSGRLPGHIFGKGLDTEHVVVDTKEFLQVFHQAGETGLVDIRLGGEKVRPVLIRDVQLDPITGLPLHIDFYQVNLKVKVKVSVPLVLIGEEPETVKNGEAIVLQTLNELEVEALPADLPDKIEVDIASLQNIDDTLNVNQLNYNKEAVTINADPEEVVVRLAPAVSAEMEKLLEEEKAAAEAAAAEAAGAAEEGEVVEGEEGAPEAEAGEVAEPEQGVEEGEEKVREEQK